MTRRLLLLWAGLSLLSCSDPTPGRTNVIWIVVDALRADALAQVDTPAIDRLARDGVCYPQAFTHAVDTLPAITSLFTSELPHHTGVTTNESLLPARVQTATEWLVAQGWHAKASVGLATLWPADARAGLKRGFEVYEQGEREIESGLAVVERVGALLEGERAGSGLFLFVQIPDPHHPYEAHGSLVRTADLKIDDQVMTRLSTSDSSWWRGSRQLAPGAHEIVLESEAAFHLRNFELLLGGRPVETRWSQHDAALATSELRTRVVVRAPRAQPAELRLWIHDAPDPEEIAQRYRLEVASADAAVAKLLAELDARGLYDSSLIVLTADHGEGLGEHGVIGHSRHLYDELLHIPLVIKSPTGHAKAGALATTTEGIARLIDVVPTVADLLDLAPKRGAQGVSLFDRGERVLIAETHPPLAPSHQVAMRDTRFKMIYDVGAEAFSMYDLVSDSEEARDVFRVQGMERKSWAEVLRVSAGR